jgi:hypothetical protein
MTAAYAAKMPSPTEAITVAKRSTGIKSEITIVPTLSKFCRL